jgi:hypothetical protein
LVQASVVIGLRAVGDLQMSDLMVGPATVDRLQPAARVRRTDGVLAVAELYAENARQFDGIDAQLQLVREGTTQLAASGAIRLSGASNATARSLQRMLQTADLEPGHYIASAIVRLGGRIVGKVSRAVEIVP